MLTASVQTQLGDFVQIELGSPDEREERVLTAPVPEEARGGRIVALTVSPPARVQERGGEGRPLELELALGPLEATTPGGAVPLGGYEDWLAVDGIETEVEPGGGAVLTGVLSESVTARFRPRQPSDEQPLTVIASPAVAASAGPTGDLALRVAGEQVVARVAAVAERFPGAGEDFVVADRALLGSALNATRPGIAVSNEVWLGAETEPEREALAADALPLALRRPRGRVARRARGSLRDDPLARGTLLTLLAAALVALGLALVGVLLGVVSDVRDERGELDDLEAQGARPALLRRVVRLRSLVVVAVGVARRARHRGDPGLPRRRPRHGHGRRARDRAAAAHRDRLARPRRRARGGRPRRRRPRHRRLPPHMTRAAVELRTSSGSTRRRRAAWSRSRA